MGDFKWVDANGDPVAIQNLGAQQKAKLALTQRLAFLREKSGRRSESIVPILDKIDTEQLRHNIAIAIAVFGFTLPTLDTLFSAPHAIRSGLSTRDAQTGLLTYIDVVNSPDGHNLITWSPFLVLSALLFLKETLLYSSSSQKLKRQIIEIQRLLLPGDLESLQVLQKLQSYLEEMDTLTIQEKGEIITSIDNI